MLFALYQNESVCETIHMQMSFTYRIIFMQIKLIFITEGFRMKTCFESQAQGN